MAIRIAKMCCLVIGVWAYGSLSCVGPDAIDGREINCANNLDDDGDGAIDCGDPDCIAAPICTSSCNFNYACEPGENNNNCPTDCPTAICGNAACEAGETVASCPADCGGAVCGNGTCDSGESVASCPQDCGGGVICGNGLCETGETSATCPNDCMATRAVDLLLVVDNSGSMAGEQSVLASQIDAMIGSMRDPIYGLPDLHIGVTSTDLGTGMFQITYCETVGGDSGNLLTSGCSEPTGQSYLIDVEPQSCDITYDGAGGCSAHTCSQANCLEGVFVSDAMSGCPRCRNYSSNLHQAVGCLTTLGTLGCGFEQPLEAMRKAVSNNPNNAGFLRASSILAILLVTDEDDCSASNPQLFDNSQTDINSTLGPLTSYRCFEFGVTCDNNSRTHQGTRQDCVPREDTSALLFGISEYVASLTAIRGSGQLVIAAIAGSVSPSTSGTGANVVVGLDDFSNPELQYSCTTAVDGAVPGVRLKSFVEAFNAPTEMAWAYTSVCAASYATALTGFGGRIRALTAQ